MMSRREENAENNTEKEPLNIKALLKSVFWFVLTVCVYILRLWYFDHRKEEKNAISFLAGVVIIGLFFLLKNLFLLLPKRFKDRIKEKIGSAVKNIVNRITNMSKRLKGGKKISKKDLSGRIRFSEERRFVFDLEERKRRAMRQEPPPKWKNIKDNPGRVRFLFLKFVARLGKKGYRYSIVSTPYENGNAWNLTQSEGDDMFRIYTVAKYSGGRVETTDAEVEYSKKCADFKG